MVSVRFEKPMRAPPRLSDVSKVGACFVECIDSPTIDFLKPFTDLIPTLDGRPEAILCGFQDVKIQLLNWKMRAFLRLLRLTAREADRQTLLPNNES